MTDKLAGIKPGDRVRVTFEGEFERGNDQDTVYIFADGGSISSAFLSGEINATTFKIERIEAPIKVGDTVFDAAAGSRAEVVGEVVTRGNRYLWLDGGASGFRTRHESAVIRA